MSAVRCFLCAVQLTPGSIYCATKSAVNSISGVLLRELVNTGIRVAEIQPGMVETEFSVVRYRGDKDRADNEYKGITPRKLRLYFPAKLTSSDRCGHCGGDRLGCVSPGARPDRPDA